VTFVADFQERRRSYSTSQIEEILEVGSARAREKAQEVLAKMESAMGFKR
jgi:hypothetical protein